MLISDKNEILRNFAAKHVKEGATLPPVLPPAFQSIRAKFPEKLDGLGYFDFQAVDWQAVKIRAQEEAAKAAKISADGKNSSAGQRQNSHHK